MNVRKVLKKIWDYRWPMWFSIVLMILIPIAGVYLLEGLSHAPWEMQWQIQLINVLIYFFMICLCSFICGSMAVGSVIVSVIVMIIGIINLFVLQFRGTPILPWDIYSFATALSVSSNYKFSISIGQIGIVCGFLFVMLLGCKIRFKIKGKIRRILGTCISGGILFAMGFCLHQPKICEWLAFDDVLFTPVTLYENNGFLAGTVINLQYLSVKEPKDYDPEKIEQLYTDFEEAHNGNAVPKTENVSKQNPNIVVIMNETFADLDVITDIETNQDEMPFIHLLQSGEIENTVSGQLYVSVCGGNTANSEYEFLTGNSMSFLPDGSIAYQQYIHDKTPSLAWYLQSLGYDTFGMHPYYAKGWDRFEVYPNFGFEETKFREQMDGAGKLRQYVSDQATYDMIKQKYADKGDAPLFTFEITMQNHGGYFKDYDNFNEEIKLLNVPDSVDKRSAERYLSLMKKSDTALKDLIKYFEIYDEPVIVLFFGDHQPADYAIKAIYEPEKTTDIDTIQKRYQVPFVMWANYDIEEEYIEAVSLNYLSSLLLDKAGVNLSPYQEKLQELYAKVPVINANGIIDAQGNSYSWKDDLSAYESDILEYEQIQYNHLFDSKHKVNEYFGVE